MSTLGIGAIDTRPPLTTGPLLPYVGTWDDSLPLWLTETEAETVLAMCATALPQGPEEVEAALFAKLGELIRAFRR